jgi:hypothetical protein
MSTQHTRCYHDNAWRDGEACGLCGDPAAPLLSQHTPGPWEVKAVNGNPGEYGLYIVDANGNDLMRGDFCRSDADANLIAAAPDMLAALREAQQTLLAVQHEVASLNSRIRAGSDAAPWVCEKVSQISGLLDDCDEQSRAAIAKVEGKS